jgi:hypothetical protein
LRRRRWQSAPSSEPIITKLQAYWDRNHPQVAIDGDGRSSIFVAPIFKRDTDALHQAREKAISQFVVLLESPTRERLARCDKCTAYFSRARAPKRNTPIFHGTYCPNCKGKGSVKRMNATRENRTKEMIELAAELWPKWKQKARYGKQSKWVAEMMNRKLLTARAPITGKWVTQHQQEIVLEAERRK